MRQGLAQIIEGEPDLEVCAEAAGVQDALRLIRTSHPDVALVDLSLQDGNGIELIGEIKAQGLGTAVLVLTIHDQTRYAWRALRAGARGYLSKREKGDVVVAAIRRVRQGEVYLSESMAEMVVAQMVDGDLEDGDAPSALLTERELEVLRLTGEGMDSHEIAQMLYLSVKTVEVHRSNVKRKLRLRTAVELHQYAYRWVQSTAGRCPPSIR